MCDQKVGIAIGEINTKIGYITKDIGHIKEKINAIEKHQEAQNGKVFDNSKMVAILDERTSITHDFNLREHNRTEKNQDEGRKINLEIIKKNSNMIMTIILFIVAIINLIVPFLNQTP